MIKEDFVKEYLSGGISYHSLGKKHGYSRALINRWVLEHLAICWSAVLEKIAFNLPFMSEEELPQIPAPPSQIQTLEKQLTAERPRN